MNLSKNIIEYLGYNCGWEEEKIEQLMNEESITFKDVLNDSSIPNDLKHWTFSMALLTEEDKQLYMEYFNIKNSQAVFKSNDIIDSYRIYNSDNVSNSSFIIESKCIEDSHYVVGSEGIYSSEQITDCEEMADCFNAHNCRFLTKSDNAYWSSDCVDSSWIIDCHNGRDLMICNDCADAHNLICCYGLYDTNPAQFFIFNKEVEPEVFRQVEKRLNRVFFDEYTMPGDRKIPTCGSADLFVNCSTAKLIEIFSKLPNYDPQIMYKISFVPDFLFQSQGD